MSNGEKGVTAILLGLFSVRYLLGDVKDSAESYLHAKGLLLYISQCVIKSCDFPNPLPWIQAEKYQQPCVRSHSCASHFFTTDYYLSDHVAIAKTRAM